MIQNYFKIAYRNIKKYKQFSMINILGLSAALTIAICMMLYVNDEMSYDKFHPDADQLYRVTMNSSISEKDFHSAWTPPFIGARMRSELPEVKDYATLYKHFKGFSIKKDNEEIAINDVYYSSPNFFDVFGFNLKFGNPETALSQPENIVLSEALANKLFPGESIMGKMIETTNGTKKVSGIIATPSENTHFHPQVVTSLIGHWNIQDLASSVNFDASFYNYIVLSKGSKLSNEKLADISKSYAQTWMNADESRKREFGDRTINLELQNVQDIHLESNLEFEMEANGSKSTVQLFLLVSILIILVASINYTNLASARYLERMKELGIRKVLGSGRWQLMVQFFAESFLLNLISAIIALVVIQLSLPLFNLLSGKHFVFQQIFQFEILLAVGLVVIGCTVVSTIYPALFISGVRAVNIFHVNSAGIGKGNTFRKSMLVLQMAISGILLVFTFVLVQQLRFMQNFDLGFEKDQVIVLEVKAREARSKIPILKDELLKLSEVKAIGLTGQIPGDENLKAEPFSFESNEGKMTEVLTNYIFSGPDIIGALGLEIKSGSNFNPEKGGANRGQEVLVNQAMVKAMNWQEPEGKKVNLPIGEAKVVGVIEDFHLKSLHHQIEPLTIIYLDNWAEALLVKLSSDDLSQTLKAIEDVQGNVIPNTSFQYSFLDDRFAMQYEHDQQQARLFLIFSIMTMVIAGMGLLGLIGFSLVRRAKEISIRQVFGANYRQVLFLLFKEYGNILLIGFLIIIPVGNYFIKEWLMGFPYKIDLSVLHFALPVAGLLSFVSLIILLRSYKTIKANPADVLRDE